jgi:hypothetical protein
MAITTGDQLVAAVAAANLYAWIKNSPANVTATWDEYSLWLTSGVPVGGAIPTVATTCTNATTGAVVYTNPTAPALTYLGYFTLTNPSNTNTSFVFLKDRLMHMGGLSGTSVGVQAVGLSVPPSRLAQSDLTNVEWFVECYTDLGATPQTLTVTYVNTASATHTAAISIPATMRSGRLLKIIPTVAGDVIQSVTSCQLGGSTGTAGNFGFTNARNLLQASLGVRSFLMDIEDVVTTGLSQVADNSCLWFLSASNGGFGQIEGSLKLIQG